jgi:hypothetical protein
MSEPDLAAASTMIVAADRALMSRFLRGKFSGSGAVSTGNSLRIAPDAAIASNRASFSGG